MNRNQNVFFYSLGPRIYKLIYDINEEIPDVSTNANLRSLREILKISSRLKAESTNIDEASIIHHAFVTFFETQLTPEVGRSRCFLSNQTNHR